MVLPKTETVCLWCLVSHFRRGTALPLPLHDSLERRSTFFILYFDPQMERGTLALRRRIPWPFLMLLEI